MKKKKKVRVKIMIMMMMMMMMMMMINKQKRVSQTFKVCNSFENDGIENQRALRASSFMLWLKFVLISWT